MRKLIATLLVFFVFVGISVAQQHQQGGGQNHNQNHGSAARDSQQHAQSQHGAQSGSQQHAQPQQRDSQHAQRPEYRSQQRPEYRGGSRPERGYRGSPYFHDRYVNRGFRWNSCRWYGPRYHMGSRFWYGGFWFEIVEVVPYDWYDDEVIIEEGPGYYLYNPRYPGIRISVVVAF